VTASVDSDYRCFVTLTRIVGFIVRFFSTFFLTQAYPFLVGEIVSVIPHIRFSIILPHH